MKKIFVLFSLCGLLSGCYSTTYLVNGAYHLSDANSSANAPIVVADENVFTDENVSIKAIPHETHIELSIKNIHKSSIRILWDESVFIDNSNSAHRVIHAGVKLADKQNAQVASVIPSGTIINDFVVPANCVEYINGDWVYSPLSKGREFTTLKDAEEEVAMCQENPSTMKLVIPIVVDDEKIEYTLSFVADELVIKRNKEYNAKQTRQLQLCGIAFTTVMSLLFAISL